MGLFSFLGSGLAKVSPAQASELQRGGAILLDVREDAEWQAGHVPGARHIPLSRLPSRMGDLPARRQVITVCRSGARSRRAASMLAKDGRDVANLAGGMLGWSRAGFPVVASGKRPGRVA